MNATATTQTDDYTVDGSMIFAGDDLIGQIFPVVEDGYAVVGWTSHYGSEYASIGHNDRDAAISAIVDRHFDQVNS